MQKQVVHSAIGLCIVSTCGTFAIRQDTIWYPAFFI